MGMDQAAGLRQWASSTGQAGSADQCPLHVAEALLELASGLPNERPPTSRAPQHGKASGSTASSNTVTSRTDGSITLMVVGLPGRAERYTQRVHDLLEAWAEEGRQWVGDPRAWRVVALGVDSPHLPLLADQQPRWALWVDSDPEAFRRAYRVLKQVAEVGGPQRLLVVHPPDIGRQGLLDNLRSAAWHYLGIELLVLAR